MQPLTLRAYDRAQKRILIINGYELTKDGQVKVYGTHYDRFYKSDDIVILRSSGIKDAQGEELFEQDVVFDQKNDLIGIVCFTNGHFVIEGKVKITVDWPPSSVLKRLDNFLLNPLALEAAVH